MSKELHANPTPLAAPGTAGELATLRRELERARQGRQAVLKLSSALLHQHTIAELGACLLQEAALLLNADTGSVMLVSPGGETFDIIADLGLPSDAPRQGVPIEHSVSGLVMSVGEPVILNGAVAQRTPQQRRLRCSMVVPISVGVRPAGVVNLSRREGEHFDEADLELMSTVASTFAAALESLRLQEAQRQLMASTIKALALAIEAKDPYTRGHCERLARYARAVAERLGLSEQLCADIEMGATLHDVGKIGVPEQVLTKAGRLTPEEFELVKQHPTRGAEIVRPVGLPAATLDAVLHHHERYDGGGYPARLVGEDIPLAGRILAIVDTFDAMTIARPYRGALSAEAALAELKRCSGTQFDPQLVTIFVDYVRSEGLDQRLTSFSGHRGPSEGPASVMERM